MKKKGDEECDHRTSRSFQKIKKKKTAKNIMHFEMQ